MQAANLKGMPGENDEEAFLSAVHHLINRRDRATQADLLLAGITHALDDVALSLDELVTRVARIWPGAPASKPEIEQTLTLGRDLGILVSHEDLEGCDEWMLTQRGADDVAVHRAWAGELRQRSAIELAERAKDALAVQLDADQAALWLDHLIKALVTGIQSAQDAYTGHIQQLVNGTIRPRNIDREQVLSSLQLDDPDRTEFLRALALSAIDPLDPFGNEIVSYITTGCILHSIVAQSARADVSRTLGEAKNERAFLDTPCLVELLHVDRVRIPLELAIRTAISQGWEVQVLAHSIEELREVFQRTVDTMPASFAAAHTRGTKDAWIASLVNDQIASMFVEMREANTCSSIHEFAKLPDSLEDRLTSLGVTIRPANNEDRGLVNEFARALDDTLSGFSRRSTTVINRDAETMCAAARRRRRQRSMNRGNKWPGCWVITTDRHMGAAFSTVTGSRVTLTLTPSQWSRLLAACAPVPDVVDLVAASANQWIEEAMWAIPVRFPPSTAVALAESLAPDAGGSLTDVKVAQLTLSDALEDRGITDAALAAQVLARRTTRREQTGNNRVSFADKAVAFERAARLNAEGARSEAVSREQRALADSTQNARDLQAVENELAWERKRSKRIIITAAMSLAGGVTLAVAVLSANHYIAWFAAITLLSVLITGYRWCTRKDAPFVASIAGGLIQGLSTLVTLADSFALIPKP